jgi:hypothetical protein
MFKPSILQINQINIIIFHQGYNYMLVTLPNKNVWEIPLLIILHFFNLILLHVLLKGTKFTFLLNISKMET